MSKRFIDTCCYKNFLVLTRVGKNKIAFRIVLLLFKEITQPQLETIAVSLLLSNVIH